MADVDIATVTGPMADYVQEGPGRLSWALLRREAGTGNGFKLFLDKLSFSTTVDDLGLVLYNLQYSYALPIFIPW
jgi:hypothetical protein